MKSLRYIACFRILERVTKAYPRYLVLLFTSLSLFASERSAPINKAEDTNELLRVPGWTIEDLKFFLHGSMSTETVPETVLRAFVETYPDLYPSRDFSNMGLTSDSEFGWPVGFSRAKVPHLGNLMSVGINCASCHVGEVLSGGRQVRVLGMTSHFDAEAFFRALIVSTFRTAAPANMKTFLQAYLIVNGPTDSSEARKSFDQRWWEQEEKISAVMKADPSGGKGIAAGGLQPIKTADLQLDAKNLDTTDLATLAHSMLRLFHNMRAALHVPDDPPKQSPPSSGPGRNDAFGLLSAVLFGEPQAYAPVKYGLVWNVEHRPWVHWDGNTQSPIGRNLLASLGLGAPLVGKQAKLDFALVKRQTDLSEKIQPPKYPFIIDDALARRGALHYETLCASCHNGPETDNRLHDVSEVGTDPLRPTLFTQKQADLFNNFLGGIETEGYEPSKVPGIRSTGKLWAASLQGVWARSPYLHNGSVRTMEELLTPSAQRAKSFHRGSREYAESEMGYVDQGSYVLDTTLPGDSNAGHDYGTSLSNQEKRELIEYLKTL